MDAMQFLLADVEGQVIPIVAVAGGMGVAIVAIVVAAIKRILTTRQVEQTKREVAAYVAEGTMSPDDAEKVLEAGPRHRRC